MKKLMTIVVLFPLFTSLISCNNNKTGNTDKTSIVLLPDTFHMHNNNVLTDKNGNKVPYVVVSPVETKTTAKATAPGNKTTTSAASTNNTSASNTSASSTAKAPAKKKGWSNSAKGAAIGGGSGAVAGAIIAGDGNRVGGAVIGSVVGAAGGYIIGKAKDKKQAKKENNQ